MTDHQRVAKRYADDNLTAATIIASNPVAYPPGSLMAQWADVVLSRAAAQPDESEAGPPFAATANRRAA